RSYSISTGIQEQVEKIFEETESQIEFTILSSIKSKSPYDEIMKRFRRLPVKQILLIGQDCDLKYPDIPWIGKSEIKGGKPSTKFTSKFTAVEEKEINGKIEEAILDYERLKTNTSTTREKAIMLNAIARSYNKIGKQDEALAIYEQVYKNFPQEKSINSTSLGAIAYLQSAGIYLEKGEIRKTAEFYAFLLRGIMYKKPGCTKDEALFYKETIENTVNNLAVEKPIKDNDLALCNGLLYQFDNIAASEKLAGIIKEKDLLREACSKRYSYVWLNDEILLGYKAISNRDALLFCLDTNRLKEKIVSRIKQALRYTEEFDYEITDPNNQIFLSSIKTRLLNPSIQESIINQLPGWQIRVRVKESEALRRNAQIRMYINIGITTVLILIIGISVYFMFRMMHRERELSRMKTDFVSSVSHEMRTPLTTIRMIGEMFQMGSVKDAAMAREYYDTLSEETQRLTRLINKALDFSRMDSGRKPYTFVMEDISKIIIPTVKAFENYSRSNGYTIELNIQHNLPKIKVDADAISQVILNLLDNAMKYSPVNKDIKIHVYKKGEKVVIEVIDRGIGIEPGEIDKIFEKFYRVEDELTRRTKGTGVGLSIVKHIVDAHEGKIEVKSKKGEGSTFTVILPMT
ncbi:GHKL domain-containing protein, partial [candidate division WOR-3 bacterium]|nr:GHKL domain-containing protein [candidate division WOR-3 bacterium]